MVYFRLSSALAILGLMLNGVCDMTTWELRPNTHLAGGRVCGGSPPPNVGANMRGFRLETLGRHPALIASFITETPGRTSAGWSDG